MKNLSFILLIMGVALVSIASSLLIVGSITLYYANLGKNALDYIILTKNQIDQLNFAYYIGLTELIVALVLEGSGAIVLIIRRLTSRPSGNYGLQGNTAEK